MGHPNGGAGGKFKVLIDFHSAYEGVKNHPSFEILSTSGETITVKPGTTRDGKHLTLNFFGKNSRHGNVCQACWGYLRNCSGTRIGHCVKPLGNLTDLTSKRGMPLSETLPSPPKPQSLSQAEIDKLCYSMAKSFIPNLRIPKLTQAVFDRYLDPGNLNPRPNSITSDKGLYRRFLESLQNASMKAAVIGRSIGGIGQLETVLFDFDPKEVLKTYGTDWEKLLDTIVEKLNPRGLIRREPQSLWPKYCKGVLSSAEFLQQFTSAEDFYGWVDFFVNDQRAMASLPMVISREIEGFGFALACDFLKELGYVDFPKPDVHLRDIFTALNLCDRPKDDYHLFRAIVRVAKSAGVTPYNADKTFWLIGSGDFYADSDIGRIPSQKKQFIRFAKTELGQ